MSRPEEMPEREIFLTFFISEGWQGGDRSFGWGADEHSRGKLYGGGGKWPSLLEAAKAVIKTSFRRDGGHIVPRRNAGLFIEATWLVDNPEKAKVIEDLLVDWEAVNEWLDGEG